MLILDKLRYKLIVSAQAEVDSPFNSPQGVLGFALSAIAGGAAGIRSEGFEKTLHIKKNVEVPVIGLLKSRFDDGFVRITGTFSDFEKMMDTRCDMIAVDGTYRVREGFTGPDFIREIKNRFDYPVMADISTFEDGIACIEAGADCISTTLSGYTPETSVQKIKGPDFELAKKLVMSAKIPVIAEGRINTPSDAAQMIRNGVWAVVVGTAITRPHVITSWFNSAITEASKEY